MRSGWQTHKGKQFFFCNYIDFEASPLQVELDDVNALIAQQPPGSVLALVDVRGVSTTREIVDMLIKSLLRNKKYLRKSVVIGIGFSGQRRVLFDTIMRITESNMMVFEELEKAKDWLVEG